MASKEDDRQLPGEMSGDERLSAVPLDAEERLDTERVLGAFAPRAPRLQRERLLALVQNDSPSATLKLAAVQLRTPWYWPAATAVMTAMSLALAVLLVWRVSAESAVREEHRDKLVEREPIVERPSSPNMAIPNSKQFVATQRPRNPQESDTPFSFSMVTSDTSITAHPEDNYLHDRRVAIEQGVDALAMSRPVAPSGRVSPPATQRELMQQFVPLAALRPARAAIHGLGWPTQQ